jgi:hypothetical protein
LGYLNATLTHVFALSETIYADLDLELKNIGIMIFVDVGV